MTQAQNYLDSHLVTGTSNQLDDVNKYIADAETNSDCVGETEKNGNEVFRFKDGSVSVRIEDEAFTFVDIEEYA